MFSRTNYTMITLLSLAGNIKLLDVLEKKFVHIGPPAAQLKKLCVVYVVKSSFRPGCGILDCFFILLSMFEGVWEFAQPVMFFVDLKKGSNCNHQWILWYVLQECGVSDPLL